MFNTVDYVHTSSTGCVSVHTSSVMLMMSQWYLAKSVFLFGVVGHGLTVNQQLKVSSILQKFSHDFKPVFVGQAKNVLLPYKH